MQPIVKLQNLPGTMSRLALASLFAQFGTVMSSRVNVDPITGRAKHTGEVRFETLDGVSRAQAAKEVEYHSAKITII